MIKSFLFFSIVIILMGCGGQPNMVDTQQNLQRLMQQAVSMSDALKKRDIISYIEFQHPKVIEMFGGKEKAIVQIKHSWEEHDADSLTIKSVIFGTPSRIIDHNGQLQCTLPQRFEFRSPVGKAFVNSSLIAISMDDGKRWYFIDCINKTLQKMQLTFPELSDELVIPESEKPKVVTN